MMSRCKLFCTFYLILPALYCIHHYVQVRDKCTQGSSELYSGSEIEGPGSVSVSERCIGLQLVCQSMSSCAQLQVPAKREMLMSAGVWIKCIC